MPAEWEAHQGTWLSWPKDPSTFPPDILPKVEETYVKMATALSAGEEVRILVDDEEIERRAGALLPSTSGVVFQRIRTVDVWVRDYGPTYVRGPGLGIVKWRFNAWGNKYEDLLPDDESGEKIAQASNLPVFRPGIVLEGGSIDVDGRGTVITTEQCLLNPNRNPGFGRAQLEGILGRFLSAGKVVWLERGIEGDDTDGHVDDMARFVGDGLVVVAEEKDPSDRNHGALRGARTRLESALDSSGRSLKVVTIPMPGPIASTDGRLPASHLNFYIGNGAVLVPTFGGKSDREAISTLRELFPGKDTVGIDCRALVHGLGTIHCVTQQIPRAP